MEELELVWIQQCDVCGREHRHIEQRCVTSADEADAESGAFRERCDNWYEAHVATLEARRARPLSMH